MLRVSTCGQVLVLPAGKEFNYSFDPNGATPVPDVGTVFESSRITDEWGVLDVTAGGVLMGRTNGNWAVERQYRNRDRF